MKLTLVGRSCAQDAAGWCCGFGLIAYSPDLGISGRMRRRPTEVPSRQQRYLQPPAATHRISGEDPVEPAQQTKFSSQSRAGLIIEAAVRSRAACIAG
jgi:hypothetical protein